jgi:cyclohexyl-isocyanide hydratase
MTLNTQMLCYPDMALLDLVGPLQAWSMWPGAEIELVWKDTQAIMTDSGLAVAPTHWLAVKNSPRPFS